MLFVFVTKMTCVVYEHTGSVSYRQCLSNHCCIYSCLVHRLEHFKLWRLKEHNVGQELGRPQHFERLETYKSVSESFKQLEIPDLCC